MIKLTDYIIQHLVEYGIKDVFMISGGGAMHLVDSVGRQKKLHYVCNHHEQAGAMAAEGYFRAGGHMAAVVVTSGPGGTNCLTGVIGQWLDSIPAIYISGQVKQETTIASCRNLKLRQVGDQEINIVDIVRPVTKYAAIVDNPSKVKYYLGKALFLATSGRPGPVWLDVPLDIQAAAVNEAKLINYNSCEDEIKFDNKKILQQIGQVVDCIKKAKRPVIVAGHGIRLANAQAAFDDLLKKLPVPVVSTFCGMDLIASDHKLFAGRIGTVGDRAGNFVLQNADLVLCVGTRNNIRQVSYDWSNYARKAFKIIVDIDKAELDKPTVKPDLGIHCDAKEFITGLCAKAQKAVIPDFSGWLGWCKTRREKYPVVLPQYWKVKTGVQPYCFLDCFTRALNKSAVVAAGNGTACVALFQAAYVKRGQRFFWNSGCASMGYDLPSAIGACVALGKKPVVCLAGDGSIQMNIQELQTIVYNKLPIKIFVLNNNGYISIRQTQDSFFAGNHVACDKSCGVSFPDIIKVAKAYGLATARIDRYAGMEKRIKKVLSMPGSIVCEVKLCDDYVFSPKLSSEKLPDGRLISKPLEDMYPFLDREEFSGNMEAETLFG